MKLRDILRAKANGEELRIRVGNKFMPINACEFDFPNVVIVHKEKYYPLTVEDFDKAASYEYSNMRAVIHKKSGQRGIIHGWDDNCVWICGKKWSYSELFNEFTWISGEHCGIKK